MTETLTPASTLGPDDIRVTWSREMGIYATSTPYVPGLHLRSNWNHWLQSLKSICSREHRDSLDLIYYPPTGNIILVQWLIKPKVGGFPACFQELRAWNPSEPWPTPAEIRDSLGSDRDQTRRMRQKLRDADTLRRILAEDTEAQKKDAARYLRNQGMDDSAKLLEANAVPYVGTREAQESSSAILDSLPNASETITVA